MIGINAKKRFANIDNIRGTFVVSHSVGAQKFAQAPSLASDTFYPKIEI